MMVIALVPASVFAADDTKAVTTVKVDFTAQLSNAFLMPPQFGVSVSSDLAESYGYEDQDSVTDGVSVLDVLVKAHELVFGNEFTADTATELLVIKDGNVSKQFGVDGDEYLGGFFVNHGFPNDGTEGAYGYNGTVVGTHKVVDGDLVEFYFYEDEYYGDTYNWFRDADGAYSRTFTVKPGEDLELTLEGFYIMYASSYKDEAEFVDCDEADVIADAQICIVDPKTGTLTEIADAVTDDDGLVTLNFEDMGTYLITAATGDASFTQVLSLTTIEVKPDPAEDITITATVSNAGTVVVPFKEVTVKDLNSDGALDIDEAFAAVHEAFYEGGAAAGYASSGGWLTKFWGDESGAFGYYLNGESAMSATDPVAEGDYLAAYIYKDQTGWSDSFAKFDKTSYTGQDSIDVTLSRMYYDASYALATEKLAGATITVYTKDYEAVDASKYTVTDNNDGTYKIEFTEAGDYLIQADNADPFIVPALAAATVTVTDPGQPADPVTVTVTISNAGTVVVPFKEVTVEDVNADGVLDIDEAFIAVHEEFYDGGAAAGYASSGGWLIKFWGDESGAFGYYLNGESAMSATDPVAEGDYLAAYIYKDQTGWTDSFAKFDKTSYTGKDSINVTLSRMYYDASYALVTEEFAGAEITVYTKDYEAVDAAKYNVTDNGDGTYRIDFNEAGDYLIQADNADPFIVPALAEAEITVTEPGAPIEINVTIANAGEVVVPAEALTVEDMDEDGEITINDAIIAAHEEWYEGGADGFATAEGQYGAYITRLWGVENGGSYGYYVNHAMAYGLTDPLAEGDYLVAYVYKDAEGYQDKYGKLTGETDDEGIVTLTLEREDFDESWNSTFVKLPKATIKVYDSDFTALADDAYTVTDNNDGTYTVELTESGDYIFIAYEDNLPLVPPVYRESVTVPGSEDDETEPVKNDLEKIYKETGDAYVKYGEDTGFAAGDEWVVLGLARAGRDIPGEEDYLAALEEYIKEKANDDEQIANASSTNSRVILTLTALGQDATEFADHDLIKGLSDLKYVEKQGLNGPTWALIALDSHEYEEAEGATATREALIAEILSKQHEDGGWSLTDTYTNSDVDTTAMTIQALAPYYNDNAEVKAAVDKALDFLSGKQNKYGGFGSVDGASSESCAQVVVALTALGIDPATDERFVKNGWSVMDALSSYYLGNGQFAHVSGGKANGLATYEAYYALASYFRFKGGETALYDMTDVDFEDETPEGPIVKITDSEKAEVAFQYDEIPEDIKLTKPIAVEVNDKEDDPDKLEILWQQDVVVPEGTKFPVTVEFKVDEEYKDKTIYIYHYNAEKKAWEVAGEGKYETFTVTMDSLSPVAMVASSSDEAPNTGDSSHAWLWAGICAAAVVCGAAVLITGRKRKEN